MHFGTPQGDVAGEQRQWLKDKVSIYKLLEAKDESESTILAFCFWHGPCNVSENRI